MNWALLRALLSLAQSLILNLCKLGMALIQATATGHLGVTLKVFARKLRDFNDRVLSDFPETIASMVDLNSPDLQALKNRVRGLHPLLPEHDQYRYSILIPVYRPDPIFFEKALRSALDQSAPHLEILIGYDGPQSPKVIDVVERLQKTSLTPIIAVQLDRGKTNGGISHTTNELAKRASGNFLLLMDHDDWIRPDLLYRYEQTLRLQKKPENTVLYCDEYKINERDEVIPSSYLHKPDSPVFPYLFINWICHCLLVPRDLWLKVGGLRSKCDGAQDFDISLRLDANGAEFKNVPVYMYAWRSHSKSTAQSSTQKDYATPAGIRALENYVAQKGLNWKIDRGYFPNSYRAIPELTATPAIHVIMPFKDAKELTLKAVKSVLNQLGVQLKITAVDNGSADSSITLELKKLSVEVLQLNEPFNYSRINNFAVKNSKYTGIPLLLFLNNDVELEAGALLEMCRWIDQPKIGIVGARLNYPSGLLQHGGVDLNPQGVRSEMNWQHTSAGRKFEDADLGRVVRICDAVTAACLLMKKSTFEAVGGFDEIWYPVAYSDTELARRVRTLGLFALYTPYAQGTHFESFTRKKQHFEDFERSSWLFDLINRPRD